MEAHLIKIDEDYGAVLSHSTSREVRCLRSSIVLSHVGVFDRLRIQGVAAGRPANIGQNNTEGPESTGGWAGARRIPPRLPVHSHSV